MANACNLSTWKAEAGRAWFVQGQPGLWIETLPQNEGLGRDQFCGKSFPKRTELFVLGETCRNRVEDNLFGFCTSVRIQKTPDS